MRLQWWRRWLSRIRCGSNAAGASRKKAEITAAEAEIAFDVLTAVTEPVESHFLWRPRLRHADDDMMFEAAANGRADAIATLTPAILPGLPGYILLAAALSVPDRLQGKQRLHDLPP
jgi:hypothetical protein